MIYRKFSPSFDGHIAMYLVPLTEVFVSSVKKYSVLLDKEIHNVW